MTFVMMAEMTNEFLRWLLDSFAVTVKFVSRAVDDKFEDIISSALHRNVLLMLDDIKSIISAQSVQSEN